MRIGAALAWLAACGPSHTAPAPTSPPGPLDAIISKSFADAHLLGLAVAVVDHGRVVVEQGYGFTDLDRVTAITPDTVFAIGSLTKQFTAAAVLRLVDEGKLKLSDHVASYLPAIAGSITIEQLVWQTAGLAEYAHGINLGKTPDELVGIIGSSPPEFAPGTKWAYSNSNYFVLGRVVEVASHQSYDDYLRDHVWSRANLTSTSACGPATAGARPSTAVGGSLQRGVPLDARFFGGAGAICSTARDLVRWQDALFGGKVLSPKSLGAMIAPGQLADGSPITYAGGWIVDHVANHPRIWHNGAVPGGYESQLAWYPDDRLQIVLLANTENSPPGQTLGALERALAALHVPVPKVVDRPLAPGELGRHAGRFKTGPLVAAITIDGDHLHGHIDGGVDSKLLYLGDERFALAGNPTVEYRFTMPAGAPHPSALEVWRDDVKLATLAPAD